MVLGNAHAGQVYGYSNTPEVTKTTIVTIEEYENDKLVRRTTKEETVTEPVKQEYRLYNQPILPVAASGGYIQKTE